MDRPGGFAADFFQVRQAASSLSDFQREMRCVTERMAARRGAQPMAIPLAFRRNAADAAQAHNPKGRMGFWRIEEQIYE